MAVEVSVLDWGARSLRKKWDKLWKDIADRVLRLPKREQHILLEDFRTAIESRILVMERINNANRDS